MIDTSYAYNCYDYALVHLLPQHEKYKNFYKKSAEIGRHVLLDNSIFELGEAYDSVEFAKWVVDLKPTEYIVPDVLEDSNRTMQSYEDFLGVYSDLPGKKIGVVQGKTYEELVECYRFMSSKADKIAISFDYSYYLENCTDHFERVQTYFDFSDRFATKWSYYALGRLQLLVQLSIDNILNTDKPHHLLGCSVPWEFAALRMFPHVRSCIETIDTSNPIVAGIIGERYNNTYGLNDKWSHKLVDFISDEMSDEQKLLAYENMRTFRKLCY